MSTPIPPPLRAVAGLAALAIDNARKLPEQLVGLPVLAVSAALQVSLKAQQRYAELVARGDEVLGQLRPEEDAPPWARFDDEPSGPPARPPSAFDTVGEPPSGAGADLFDAAGDAGFDAVSDAGLDPDVDAGFDSGSGSAFDAGFGPAGGSAGDAAGRSGADAPLDELAAEQLGGGEPEATLLADAEVAGWGGGAGDVGAPDGVSATEAEAGGIDVAEIPLDDAAPGVDLPAGSVTGTPLPTGAAAGASAGGGAGRKAGKKAGAGRPTGAASGPGAGRKAGQKAGPGRKAGAGRKTAGREAGAVSEPGVDLPADRVGDAAETGAALAASAAGREPGSVGEPGVDLPTGLTADAAAVDQALESGLDGYLAVDPPIPHYDELSIPQLRGRLRSLGADQLAELVAYERANAARPPYLTMLENRLTTLRAR